MTHKFEDGINGKLGVYPYESYKVVKDTGNCQYCGKRIDYRCYFKDRYDSVFYVGSECAKDADNLQAVNWAGLAQDNYYRTTYSIYLVSKGCSERDLLNMCVKPSRAAIKAEYNNLPSFSVCGFDSHPDYALSYWTFDDYRRTKVSRMIRSLKLIQSWVKGFQPSNLESTLTVWQFYNDLLRLTLWQT